MTDYQKTKIYKIESHLGDKIYVGSTAKEYLSQRFQYHRSGYKLWKSGKSDKVMSYDLFDEYGLENCQIVLIEAYPCNTKDEKNARESHFIRTLTCVNKVIPNRTRKERYEDNKDKITEQAKSYREANKEKIVERAKKYRETNKEKISEQKKKYHEATKEKRAEKAKIYYEANKEKLIEKRKQRAIKKREDNQ